MVQVERADTPFPSHRSLNQGSHRSKMATESTQGSTATLARLLSNGLGARGDQDRDPLEYPRRNLHVLLALSGSVASIKAPLIVRELLTVRLQAIASRSAAVTPLRLCPFRLAPNLLPFLPIVRQRRRPGRRIKIIHTFLLRGTDRARIAGASPSLDRRRRVGRTSVHSQKPFGHRTDPRSIDSAVVAKDR